jgi:hypothetical protein
MSMPIDLHRWSVSGEGALRLHGGGLLSSGQCWLLFHAALNVFDVLLCSFGGSYGV